MEEQKKVSSEAAQKSLKREGQKKQQRSESKPKKQAKEKVEKKPAAKEESELSDQKIEEKAEQLKAEKEQSEQALDKPEDQKVEEQKQDAAKKLESPFRAGSKKAFLFKLLSTTPTALTRDEISEKMKESGNQTSHSVISSWIRSIKRKGFTVDVVDNDQKKATYRVVKPGGSPQ